MSYIAPILLLCCSNVFMTFAWVRRVFASQQRRESQSASGALRATNAPSTSEAPEGIPAVRPTFLARFA
jgi:hypothetical protein